MLWSGRDAARAGRRAGAGEGALPGTTKAARGRPPRRRLVAGEVVLRLAGVAPLAHEPDGLAGEMAHARRGRPVGAAHAHGGEARRERPLRARAPRQAAPPGGGEHCLGGLARRRRERPVSRAPVVPPRPARRDRGRHVGRADAHTARDPHGPGEPACGARLAEADAHAVWREPCSAGQPPQPASASTQPKVTPVAIRRSSSARAISSFVRGANRSSGTPGVPGRAPLRGAIRAWRAATPRTRPCSPGRPTRAGET